MKNGVFWDDGCFERSYSVHLQRPKNRKEISTDPKNGFCIMIDTHYVTFSPQPKYTDRSTEAVVKVSAYFC
jgi:hypothetical protein